MRMSGWLPGQGVVSWASDEAEQDQVMAWGRWTRLLYLTLACWGHPEEGLAVVAVEAWAPQGCQDGGP